MDLDLSKPLTLQCGLTLPNRLVKAAMAENMADASYLPASKHQDSYRRWGEGGWGMIITGNVFVNTKYHASAHDVAFDPKLEAQTIELWTRWASDAKQNGTPVVMQINHAGRQSALGSGSRSFFEKNLAPSPIPLKLGDGMIARAATALVFGTPRAMTRDEIKELVSQFARTARLAAQCGFSGVQIHAAHGYLLSEFLSSDDNKREDEHGGTAENRARAVVEVVEAVRAAVPASFCVGVKFNSGDHRSPEKLRDCIKQLKLIEAAGIDFIEISGGSYERPQMYYGGDSQTANRSATPVRGAFFLEFAKAIRSEFRSVPLIVTGGFRSRQGMETAVKEGDCDFVGLGRPSTLNPALPSSLILNEDVSDAEARLDVHRVESPYLERLTGFKAVGITAETAWYSDRLQKLGDRR